VLWLLIVVQVFTFGKSKQDERYTPIEYTYFPSVLCYFCTLLALDVHLLQTQYYFDSHSTVHILLSCIIRQDLYFMLFIFFLQ
jgi:hypothetical protein